MKNIVILTQQTKYFYHSAIASLLKAVPCLEGFSLISLDISAKKADHLYLQEISSLQPTAIITLDLAGFRFRTQSGESALNMLPVKIMNLIWGDRPEYDPFLSGKLSLSMHFFDCLGNHPEMLSKYTYISYYCGKFQIPVTSRSMSSDVSIRSISCLQDMVSDFLETAMCQPPVSPSALQNIESRLSRLTNDKHFCLKIYTYMRQKLDDCLSSKSYRPLFDLLPYFEEPESYPHFYLSADTQKIYSMLSFLQLELKYHKLPFISSCSNCEEFLEQYTKTVFAFRRLELNLSQNSVDDAVHYLLSVPLNIYCCLGITQNEYFENMQVLYQNIYQTLAADWSPADKEQWLDVLSNYVSNHKTL